MKLITDKLFEYDNYRSFLKDYYAYMKKRKSVFSLKYFAQKAGFGSASFCMYVIDGRRNLSYNSIPKMNKGLGFSGKKAKYFESLVLMNQATSVEERERYAKEVERLRKTTKYYRLKKQQFTYFEHWYYAVIRELVVSPEWNGDYNKLAQMVKPSITAEKAKKAVSTLLDIGLIKQSGKNQFAQCENAITAKGLPSFITKKARKDLLLKGVDALENLGPEERHLSCSTVSLSAQNYARLNTMLDNFHTELAAMSAEDDGKTANTVFQVNLQAFPLSKKGGQT